jgi:hypothetical protein
MTASLAVCTLNRCSQTASFSPCSCPSVDRALRSKIAHNEADIRESSIKMRDERATHPNHHHLTRNENTNQTSPWNIFTDNLERHCIQVHCEYNITQNKTEMFKLVKAIFDRRVRVGVKSSPATFVWFLKKSWASWVEEGYFSNNRLAVFVLRYRSVSVEFLSHRHRMRFDTRGLLVLLHVEA